MEQKKVNGKKNRAPIVCPHAESCAAPQMHTEVMASLDQISASVGMLLEQQERHSERLVALAGSIYDVSGRQILADQREAEWLRVIQEMARVKFEEARDD